MPGNHHPLLQLTYIRFVILLGQSLALLFAFLYIQANLEIWVLASALGLLGFLNLMTYARLHSPWPVTSPELFSHLLADTILYGFILYHSGGGTNPFIFMLLIPLIITAMTLERPYILLMASLVITIYGSLLVYYIPVTTSDHQHGLSALFDMHMIGMWLNFILTTFVITYFVSQISDTVQRQQRRLAENRETQIHQQQVLSLGTLAAGTAHELGTPLSTMQVILHDMSLDSTLTAEQREDIDTLTQQVDFCAQKLRAMARTVAQEQNSSKTSLITEFLDEVIEQWKITRPEVTFSLTIQDSLPPDIHNTTALRQAILNLLNNAADACPDNIEIALHWSDEHISLLIRDYGAGLPIDKADDLGKPFITTKGKGLGIGLFLTSSTLATYDGDVRLYNAEGQGTMTEVTLARRVVHG